MNQPAIMLEDGTLVTFEMFTSMTEAEKCAFEEKVRNSDTYSIPVNQCPDCIDGAILSHGCSCEEECAEVCPVMEPCQRCNGTGEINGE